MRSTYTIPCVLSRHDGAQKITSLIVEVTPRGGLVNACHGSAITLRRGRAIGGCGKFNGPAIEAHENGADWTALIPTSEMAHLVQAGLHI